MKSNTTLVMGILNITPDSFADGGRHFDFAKAINRSEVMLEEGVDIIDVGGESTRPGAERISEAEERERVIPVIAELKKLGVAISVDTMRSKIANEAIKAGATYVNDVGELRTFDFSKERTYKATTRLEDYTIISVVEQTSVIGGETDSDNEEESRF